MINYYTFPKFKKHFILNPGQKTLNHFKKLKFIFLLKGISPEEKEKYYIIGDDEKVFYIFDKNYNIIPITPHIKIPIISRDKLIFLMSDDKFFVTFGNHFYKVTFDIQCPYFITDEKRYDKKEITTTNFTKYTKVYIHHFN